MGKTTSLVPQQLTRNSTATVKKKILSTPDKKPKTDHVLHNNYSDDSDNDGEVQNDFFSIHKTVEIPVYNGPLDIDKPKEVTQNQKPRSIESYFKKDVPEQGELQPNYEGYANQAQYMDVQSNYGMEAGPSHSGETAASSNNVDVVLDDEAVSITESQCGISYKKDFFPNIFASMFFFYCRFVNYAAPAANGSVKRYKSSMSINKKF